MTNPLDTIQKWQPPVVGKYIESSIAPSALKVEAKEQKAAAKVKRKKAVAAVRAEVTARDKADIIARDDGICMLCLTPCTEADPPEVDHIRPASQFPRKCESNMACLHKSCNIAKGARTDAVETILRNMAAHEAQRHAVKPEKTEAEKRAAYEWRVLWSGTSLCSDSSFNARTRACSGRGGKVVGFIHELSTFHGWVRGRVAQVERVCYALCA